jgi:hypothetical protein
MSIIKPTLKPIPYAEDIRPQDTDLAIQTVKVQLFPNDSSPLAIDFQGACPRCGDPIEIRQWIVAFAGALKMNDKQMKEIVAQLEALGVGRPSGDEMFDLTCTCAVAHPDRPKDKHGCGARFRVRATWS